MQYSNKPYQATSVVESGILTAIAILFAFLSVYVPVLGVFINLIWPVPIILLGVRHGLKYSLLATVASGILIALLIHPLQALSVAIGFGFIGIMLGYALKQTFSPFKTLFYGAVVSLLSKGLVLFISSWVMGVNPLNFDMETMRQGLDEALEMYRSFGMTEEQLGSVKTTFNTVLEILPLILPSGFILASLVDTYLNFWLARKVLGKLGFTVEGFPPFKEWSLPMAMNWFFFASLALVYLGQVQEIEILRTIGLNLQILTVILLLTQGLALIYFLADKYNLSRFLRGLILFMILTNGLFTELTVLAGAVEIIIDYRKLRHKGS